MRGGARLGLGLGFCKLCAGRTRIGPRFLCESSNLDQEIASGQNYRGKVRKQSWVTARPQLQRNDRLRRIPKRAFTEKPFKARAFRICADASSANSRRIMVHLSLIDHLVE